MRFQEFKVLKEATGTLGAISQVADIANKFLDPLGSLGGAATDALGFGGKNNSEISVPGGTSGSGFSNFKSSGSAINPTEIKSYLKSKGLDNNQIAGLLVSIKWESNFKPGAYIAVDAGQGQSGGFFGFHDVKNGKGNFTDMVAYCGGPDKWATNWQGQLDFALKGPKGREYASAQFRTPGEAASWWVKNYEKPQDTVGQARKRADAASQYA